MRRQRLHQHLQLAAASLLVVTCCTQSLRAQNLTHLSPVGFTPGTTTRVTLYGEGLANVRQLWTSFASQAQRVEDPSNSDKQVLFDLTVPADVPVGTYGIRCATDTAMSDLRIVVVDDLSVQVESGTNTSEQAPQPLTIPTAVDGYILPEQARFFSLEAAEGQTVSLEVVGHRFGTGFDPLLRILAADGKELLFHDNDEGLGYDFRFEFTFPAAGQYILELRDTRFQGGLWPYHMRIGDFPIARVGFPAGLQRGRLTNVAFPGRTATDVAPTAVSIPPDDLSPWLQWPVHGVNASTWITLATDTAESQLELEPNNTNAEANATLLGRTLDGRLQEPGDTDAYRFNAKAGQAVYFRAETRRLASPADLVARLFDAQGNEVASNDDQGTADAEFSFNIPADNTYILLIEDLNRRGGPEFVYRMHTQVARREFVLRPSTDRAVIARGSFYPIPVALERTGLADAIQVTAETVPPTSPVGQTTIPAAALPGIVVVRIPPDAPLGPTSIRLRAVSQGDVPVHSFASLTNLLRPKLDNLLLLPPSTETDIAVSIVDRTFFSLAARVDAPAVARFTSTPLVVEASREKFFDEPITLAVENLPQDIAIKVEPIAKGASAIRLQIASNPKSPLGQFPILISGTAAHSGRSLRVYAEPLILDIRPAVALTIDPPQTTIAQGAKVLVTVRATRLPAYNGPVEISLANLPAGVTASNATIAEGASEVAIELVAAPDAAEADVQNLVAKGTFAINKQNEAVESPPAKLKVTKP